MRADSLAAAPRLCNSVDDRLSHLFLVSFQHFYHHRSSKTIVFIQQLRTLAGLSYAACSFHETYLIAAHIPFKRFMRHTHGDFCYHLGAMPMLSCAVAKLVVLANESFRLFNYPSHYHAFMQTLRKLILNEPVALANRIEEAKQLLQTLQNHSQHRPYSKKGNQKNACFNPKTQ